VIQLLAAINLKRNWAVTVIDEPTGNAVHSAFEAEADAGKLADVLLARTIGQYPGWASQRSFRLDANTRKAISAGLRGHRGK